MAELDLFAFRHLFELQNVLICFNGPFSHSIIEELGKAVKNYLAGSNAPPSRISDVFAAFVEQAQNIKNYTARTWHEDASCPEECLNGTLAIAREGERYVVSSGNVVRAEDAAILAERLRGLAGLDATALKAAYKAGLREPRSKDGGAGLGLIDMARKSAEPLRFATRDLPDGYVFFSIGSVV
jgi:hypothetical protein